MNQDEFILIQWNCRGIKSKHEELQLLIAEYNPSLILLQETKLNQDKYILNTKYDVHNFRNMEQPQQGGVAIAVQKNVNYKLLNIQTNLQAIAIKLQDESQLTI